MPVILLLLQHLFPGWTITREEGGTWKASVSVSDVDELLGALAAADPGAARRAASLLKEGK
ncbi:hypothetical protein [Actinomadura chokoriensis]|uniref:Uncharacterized protein n=1 Tax=Actinomadura chokoriensis TaxID=454156 RepID=A0ABV4QU28_9ACTN